MTYEGRLRDANSQTRIAVNSALKAGDAESAAVWQVEQALWTAEFGLPLSARSAGAVQAIALAANSNSRNVQILAALAEAAGGDVQHAELLADKLARLYPQNSLLKSYWLPVIHARIALRAGNAALAIKLLDSTTPFETGFMDTLPSMYAVYIRAQAHLAAHESALAVIDFRRILAHRGLLLNCPTVSLAQLGLARSLAQAGDTAGSRSAYQDLFVLWMDADKDFTVFKQAQSEYRALR
jgi:hypothetical protein